MVFMGRSTYGWAGRRTSCLAIMTLDHVRLDLHLVRYQRQKKAERETPS